MRDKIGGYDMTIYDFELEDNQGKSFFAGFPRQGPSHRKYGDAMRFYAAVQGLEELYRRYKDYGFEIIDVPCNQFMNQAPEDDRGIQNFCSIKYDTTFLRMKKSRRQWGK